MWVLGLLLTSPQNELPVVVSHWDDQDNVSISGNDQ